MMVPRKWSSNDSVALPLGATDSFCANRGMMLEVTDLTRPKRLEFVNTEISHPTTSSTTRNSQQQRNTESGDKQWLWPSSLLFVVVYFFGLVILPHSWTSAWHLACNSWDSFSRVRSSQTRRAGAQTKYDRPGMLSCRTMHEGLTWSQPEVEYFVPITLWWWEVFVFAFMFRQYLWSFPRAESWIKQNWPSIFWSPQLGVNKLGTIFFLHFGFWTQEMFLVISCFLSFPIFLPPPHPLTIWLCNQTLQPVLGKHSRGEKCWKIEVSSNDQQHLLSSKIRVWKKFLFPLYFLPLDF